MEEQTREMARLTPKHYETLAKWAKEMGLGAGGVLIAPQLLKGFALTNSLALFGTFFMVGMFALAYYWLRKS